MSDLFYKYGEQVDFASDPDTLCATVPLRSFLPERRLTTNAVSTEMFCRYNPSTWSTFSKDLKFLCQEFRLHSTLVKIKSFGQHEIKQQLYDGQ